MLADIAEFGRLAFPSAEGTADPLTWAKGVVPEVAGSDDWHIFHRLNEFLATEPRGSFVQTGTVFQTDAEDGGKPVAWICVTPGCDLVPRMPRSGTWEHTLHPIRPMIAIRGLLIDGGVGVLRNAERFHHVYLTIDGVRKAVKVVESTDPTAKLELFLLDDMGRIRETDAACTATRLSKSKRRCPSCNADELQGDRSIT